MFFHASFRTRSVKATYGTGSSLMMATGSGPRRASGLASTIAWGLATTEYALEGNIYATGAAVQWTADLLGLGHPSDVADLAAQAAPSHEVFVVPAFVGLGAPYWDESARGIVTGLTRDTGRIHLARAAIDAIAYQIRDVFEAMQAAVSEPLAVLLADGGVTRNAALMQFQADMLGTPVQRNNAAELSAMGAAYLAGLTMGIWASTVEIEALERSVDRFEPKLDESTRERLYQSWQSAVARARFRPS
jgi:glycerol kinase